MKVNITIRLRLKNLIILIIFSTITTLISCSKNQNVLEISLTETSISLNIGDEKTLSAKITPENSPHDKISWSSSNSGIASVDENGKISAISCGETIVSASIANKSAICHVTVTQNSANKPSIYLAGMEDQVATVWINGIATRLSEVKPSSATGIYVDGNDTYVCGYERSSAVVWKNGVPTYLSGSSTTSICVSKGNVYIAGYSINAYNNFVAKLWINGKETTLSDGTKSYCANSVAVSNDKIYVLGWGNNYQQTAVAKLWINGEVTDITDGTYRCYPTAMYIFNNDLYIATNEEIGTFSYYISKLWKNGKLISTTDNTNSYKRSGLFISENNIYTSGYCTNGGNSFYAQTSKNETFTPLSEITPSVANGIFVVGADIYTCGYEKNNGAYIGTLWINENKYSITDGKKDAYINAIFIN